MNTSNNCNQFFTTLISLIIITLLAGCSREVDAPEVGNYIRLPGAPSQPVGTVAEFMQFKPDNSQYLFDVTEHSIDELQALLNRINEIAESGQAEHRDLEIVMILHGPDINLFTYQSYEANKSLVDLAAKLDAFRIIDMKVCETALQEVGVNRTDLPAFIESVPYAPREKQRLTNRGYITL